MDLPTDGLIVDFDPEVAFAHLDPGDLVETPVVSTDGRTYTPHIDEGVSHVRVGMHGGLKTLAPNYDVEWPWPKVEMFPDEPIEFTEITILVVGKATEEGEYAGVFAGGNWPLSYSTWYLWEPEPEDGREEGLLTDLYAPTRPDPYWFDPAEVLGGVVARGDADGFRVVAEKDFHLYAPTSEADWRPLTIGTQEWEGLQIDGTDVLRVLIWDRALTEGEMDDVVAEWDRYRFGGGPDNVDVQVSWVPPAHDGGAPITGYEVWAETESGIVVRKTSEPHTELTIVRGGRVEVVAVNAAGRSTPVWAEQGEGGSS